ncbi:hypothetical protein L9H26_18760 [Morganella psychrotolerans]|uniref:Uncharacterized protein n=1 Tax=Morganella psychrotolerans TaxID=368603 RepID=A0A5M9QXY6_9GAMM|nr:hypothetical protein [Morganella psychrotolerans]KAA8713051.1 hypothetical protein F4V73_18225 [Morganella psychrotolerans]OBU01950.1 hypothetical protein AYY16_17235 [Morganella psychrotolerans]
MKPAKVRLLESAFAGYTGVMSGVMFKDGVSLSEIPFIDQQRICSVMKAETIDGKNVSGAAALSESRNVSAKDAVAAEKAAAPVVTMERESDSVEVRYTRAELEALADKGGIAALRKVGNEHGVREKSIEAMIEGILNVAGGE